MIVLDTSGLLALLDRGEPDHKRAHAAVDAGPGPRLVIDLVTAETDFLLLKRLGRKAELAFVGQLLDGTFLREPVSDVDLRRAAEIIGRYADADIGLTDACVMAIAERTGARAVLTLDRRHFTPFRDKKGRALELLPAP